MAPPQPGFSDPAIMSATRFAAEAAPAMSIEQQQYLMGYGPPPGLHPQNQFNVQNMQMHAADGEFFRLPRDEGGQRTEIRAFSVRSNFYSRR
jgi:hypothetical protein